jgi:hypothetical protein
MEEFNMADSSLTDPSDMDPIQQASVGVVAANIKTFGDLQLQLANLSLQEAIANQGRMNAYGIQSVSRAEALNSSIVGKVTDMLLDKTAAQVANAVVDQVGAKIAQTTPPVYQDPTNGIAAIAAQMSAVVQLLQGLSVSGV